MARVCAIGLRGSEALRHSLRVCHWHASTPALASRMRTPHLHARGIVPDVGKVWRHALHGVCAHLAYMSLQGLEESFLPRALCVTSLPCPPVHPHSRTPYPPQPCMHVSMRKACAKSGGTRRTGTPLAHPLSMLQGPALCWEV